MNQSNYPTGANTKDAPWNQVDNPEREIEVTVSITLSKSVKVKVSDYIIVDSEEGEDGELFEDIDYSDCNLEDAVKNQIILPQEAYKYVNLRSFSDVKTIIDLKNWVVDDFEVLKE